MRPDRRFIMANMAARQMWNMPSRPVSSTARQSASSSRASGRSLVIPAQLTAACTGPSSSCARWNQEATSAASVTSTSTARTRPPSSETAFSTWRTACSSPRWQKLTSQPAAASLRTVAAPMPLEPSLTRATLR
jgi:hypothetical protein